MRAYFFGNMYLSSIQQGIQAAHCISNVFAAHEDNLVYESKDYLFDWAHNHKTMILLNAGFSSEIENIHEFFDLPENPFPNGVFHEADDALGGAITCACIVIPERIYRTAQLLREDKTTYGPRSIKEQLWEDGEVEFSDADNNNEKVIWEFTKWEAQLCERLNRYGMAK